MSEVVKNPLKLFYCYAHQDKDLRNALDKHLSELKHQKLIEIWYDGEIGAGIEWECEIDKHLSTADIVLLLVSADFLASKYIYDKEMTRALQRHEEGMARVVPIIMRPVYWKNAPFSKLQMLPTGAKPVTSWVNVDEAYENIARKLNEVVEKLLTERKFPHNEDVATPLKPLHTPPPSQTANQGLLATGMMNVLNNLNRYWMVPLQTHANTYNNRGVALNNRGQYKEALEAYGRAIRIYPNHALAYSNIGNTLNNLKRHEEALEACEQAIRLDPNHAFTYYSKGNALYNLERYKEALKAYEQAIQIDSTNASAYTNKGATLSKLKRHEEALEACEQAIRLDPKNAFTYNNKGATLDKLSRYEEALKAYDQAIQIDVNYANAYNNKGVALNNLQRYQDALEACEQAIHLDPDTPYVYSTKGFALNGLERYEEALVACEQAIQINPENEHAYRYKGNALNGLGQAIEAEQAYEKARELGWVE